MNTKAEKVDVFDLLDLMKVRKDFAPKIFFLYWMVMISGGYFLFSGSLSGANEMFLNQSLLGFLRSLVGAVSLVIWPFFISLMFGMVVIFFECDREAEKYREISSVKF